MKSIFSVLIFILPAELLAENAQWYSIKTNYAKSFGEYQVLVINDTEAEVKRYIQQGNPFECVIGRQKQNELPLVQHFSATAEIVLPPKSLIHLYDENAAILLDNCLANVFYFSSKIGGFPEGNVKSNLNGKILVADLLHPVFDYEDKRVKVSANISLIYGKSVELSEVFINKYEHDIIIENVSRDFYCGKNYIINIANPKVHERRRSIDGVTLISSSSMFSYKIPLDFTLFDKKVTFDDKVITELSQCKYVASYRLSDSKGGVTNFSVEKHFGAFPRINLSDYGAFDFE